MSRLAFADSERFTRKPEVGPDETHANWQGPGKVAFHDVDRG
jgi:hypothetical protein